MPLNFIGRGEDLNLPLTRFQVLLESVGICRFQVMLLNLVAGRSLLESSTMPLWILDVELLRVLNANRLVQRWPEQTRLTPWRMFTR
jgi:hypothetical protein